MNSIKPINIDNLAEASAQEVFDHIALHLLTQNKQSRMDAGYQGSQCAYRTVDGLACAAGSLFTEAQYLDAMQKKSPVRTAVRGAFGIEGAGWGTVARMLDCVEHVLLISGLQGVHDSCPPEDWPHELKVFASRYELNSNVVDDFQNKKTCLKCGADIERASVTDICANGCETRERGFCE